MSPCNILVQYQPSRKSGTEILSLSEWPLKGKCMPTFFKSYFSLIISFIDPYMGHPKSNTLRYIWTLKIKDDAVQNCWKVGICVCFNEKYFNVVNQRVESFYLASQFCVLLIERLENVYFTILVRIILLGWRIMVMVKNIKDECRLWLSFDGAWLLHSRKEEARTRKPSQ